MTDCNRLLTRRSAALGLIGGAGALLGGRALAQAFDRPPPPPGGFGPGGPPPPMGKPYVFESAVGPNGQCVLIPNETEGPYPVDLAANAAMHRIDITENRPGLPLDLEMVFVDVHAACRPIAGARVDLWQCDKDGIYSGVRNIPMAQGARDDDTRGQTFLRGVQTTDATGRVRFRTIYPGWYPSRLTHIHYQLYLKDGRVVTSQIAFPDAITHAVYDSPLYKAHGQNSVIRSFAEDSVFGDDGGKYQMVTLTGDARNGFKGLMPVGVAAS